MKSLFVLLLGIALWWGYKNDVHENLKQLYEYRDEPRECDRQMNIIESKMHQTFFEYFSGCIVQPWNDRYDLRGPMDLSHEALRITRGCTSREERIKAIYRWVTTNIAYDTDYQIYTADECYRERRGVCSAYAQLTVKMLGSIGIPAIVVRGEVKHEGDINLGRHAWVMIDKGDGDYLLADPTWDAGGINEETGKFIAKPTWEWFDCSPERMIHSHFPESERHQLLDKPVSKEEFDKMPYMRPC